MDEPICPACRAQNDDDAAYCDQCGQPLRAPEAPAEDGDACPACGGVVESAGDGKGVCSRCGLELVETPGPRPDAPVADDAFVAKLTAAIARRAGAGMPLADAVRDACHEVLGEPPAAPAEHAAPAGEPMVCPLCGAENPARAAHCSSCSLWFEDARGPLTCPRCERAVRGGKCECGALLTLPRLLEYVEPSVRCVCLTCKTPYAVVQHKCPTCGGGTVSADRLKAFAAGLAEGTR